MDNNTFITLPEDILLRILYRLKITDLFQLQIVSTYFNNKIKLLQSQQVDFWKNTARLTCAEERLEEGIDFKQLLLRHANFTEIMKGGIEKGTIKHCTKSTLFKFKFFELNCDDYILGNAQ